MPADRVRPGADPGPAPASGDSRDAERVAEARRTLDRLSAESETIGGSALARMARHFSAGDAPPGDRVETWGRRIGRLLALMVAAYLLVTVARMLLH